MQFGNKNNDLQIIAQILANRRQPVSGGSVVLPQQAPQVNKSITDGIGEFLNGTDNLLGSFGLGKGFDFDAMKEKYSRPYTTSDIANDTFGGFPSIDYGLNTKNNYETPSWLGGQTEQSNNMRYGLPLNKIPQFRGFGG